MALVSQLLERPPRSYRSGVGQADADFGDLRWGTGP
jgi:hypothetical protein